jgi:starch phosphorylase
MVNFALASKIPERIIRLEELAHNIWWSWHPRAQGLFRSLDYPLWRANNNNPVKLLYQSAPELLRKAAEDPGYLNNYDAVMREFDAEMGNAESWFSTHRPWSFSGTIAYFSMEFALHNSLPIYAGGLGILAGDMCKEASDLGLPLIGIGFMYPQGYFHQHISDEGWQQEIYQHLDFAEAPINQILAPDGRRAVAEVTLAGRSVSIAVWLVRVGRVNIYLLDTNVEGNTPDDRQLSARLYIAEPEMRIQQEIVLGIGGVRILRALGINPVIWHANEGHSAFMALERAREEVAQGLSFEQAVRRVRETTVFTTHTPVPYGHDSFPPNLMDKYFADFCSCLAINRDKLFEMGRPDIRGLSGFNMTALAMNTAKLKNAVSRIHELETKKMWAVMWPDLAADKFPISSVTNGVHVPTWIGFQMVQLFDKYLGPDWVKQQDDQGFWDRVLDIPDEEIWTVHRAMKGRLIEVIMERAQRRWAEGEVSAQQVVTMGALLIPQHLTIGFARRVTEYKRPTLIFQDLPRLKKIINDPWHPVQIVFAGKSHPADFSGKYMLHKIFSTALDREFQGRVAFVEDYDMHMGSYMTHGIDVWLNNPYRLQEASGTSGMKAAVNGVPNLSVRDGWWDEGYNGKNGWALGAGPEAGNSPDQNQNDAEALYRLLEEQVVPLYYDQDRKGIPRAWIKMVKESIRTVLPRFSATRMVKDYANKMYFPLVQP